MDNGPMVPLSQASSDVLRLLTAIPIDAPEGEDVDFIRRYAAILLRERGM